MKKPRPSRPTRDRGIAGLWKHPLAAGAVGVLIGLVAAYGVWSVLRTPGDPRVVDLAYDGLDARYPTGFLPIQHRTYRGFDAEFFSGEPPERRFGFDAARDVEDRWRVAVVGDIMAHDSLQISAFTRRDAAGETAGGYDWLLADAKAAIDTADLAVGNLETVVSARVPRQGFPAFNADPQYLEALANLGFDAVTSANNHILDHGAQGLRDTERNLAAHGLAFTGTSGAPREGVLVEVTSETATDPLILGIVAYTDYVNGDAWEHIRDHEALAEVNYLCINKHWTFRAFVRWLAPETCHADEAGFYDEIEASIAALRDRGADYVAVFMHRLRAYEFFPSEQARRQAVEIARRDADAVISTGSHSIMPVERLYSRDGEVQAVPDAAAREHLIVHGLGNFVSTQGGASAYGLIAGVDIGRDGDGRFVHAVSPSFARSELTLEPYPHGERDETLEILRLRVLDLEAFLADVRDR